MQFIFPIKNLSVLFLVLFFPWHCLSGGSGGLFVICFLHSPFVSVMESGDREHDQMEVVEMGRQKNLILLVRQNWIGIWNSTTTCIELTSCRLKPEFDRCIVRDERTFY